MSIYSKSAFLLAASLIGCVATSAQAAVTLNFDGLRNKSRTSYTYVTGPYQESGFTLNSSLCQGRAKTGCFIGVQPFKSMDLTGGSIATQYVSTLVTLTRDNGAAFMLQSIDFSEYFDNLTYQPYSIDVNFSYNFADGTTGAEKRTFSTDGRYLPTTFNFALAPVTAFSWKPVTGSGVQFDTIAINDVATAVPEPTTWALMLVGFGLMGASMRTRRRTRPAAFA